MISGADHLTIPNRHFRIFPPICLVLAIGGDLGVCMNPADGGLRVRILPPFPLQQGVYCEPPDCGQRQKPSPRGRSGGQQTLQSLQAWDVSVLAVSGLQFDLSTPHRKMMVVAI